MKRLKRLGLLLLVCMLTLSFVGCKTTKNQTEKKKDILIGISWRADVDSEFYTNITDTLDELHISYKLLDEVKLNKMKYNNELLDNQYINEANYLKDDAANKVKTASFSETNIPDVLKGVDGVIFTGGEDVSPTLYKQSEDWYNIAEEKDYNATRDINDYLLVSYCIDKDIPAIGFCRGMQMLGIVGGASVIQDIPTDFASKGINYDNTHRNVKETPDSYRGYSVHDIKICDKNSKLYKIFKEDTIENVPSWHHQALASVDGTKLKVTATTKTCGKEMIEAIEYTDKSFIVGMQFHPEVAITKKLRKAKNNKPYMAKKKAEKIFKKFAKNC